VGRCIRSEMTRGWFEGVEGNLGVGIKVGRVGIHGENQISRH
jgi:hypothetical protein